MASIRKRRDRKSWVVDCRDVPNGRRVVVKTREQAEFIRAEMIRQSQQAQPVTQDRDIKLDAFADRWLVQIATSVEPRTLDSYKQNWRVHIKPAFGGMKVRAIHRGHIKALLAQKRAAGLAKNSVRLIRATLSVMLGDAIDDGILQINPAAGIGRRGRKSPDSLSAADRQKKIKVMTYEQLATFLAVASARCSARSASLFLLMADTGLRPGEACGVQWADLDRETLRAERAVEVTGRVKNLKTDKSRRVDLSARAAAVLSDLRAMAEAEVLAAGKGDVPAWIFATRAGTPPRPHRLAKTFRKVAKAAELPGDLTLYSLRHTYVSHLIATGAVITYIANQVGHSKVTTTLTYYAHLFPNGDRRHIDEMERIRIETQPLEVAAVPADDIGIALDDDEEWPRFGPGTRAGARNGVQAPENIGEPSGDRTQDPLIKSQVLSHLS
jgi:integrase